MKTLVPAALLALAAFSAPALAQVYGGEDDPYSQNPFASNMALPDPAPTPAPAAQPQPSTPPQDTAKPPQTGAASTGSPAPAKPAP